MQLDWSTLALQTINVLILTWILARFFYRPIANIIAKRRAEAQKMLTDADAVKKAAEKQKDEIATAHKEIAAKREETLAEARKEAETARSALLEEARVAAEKIKADGESEWRRERTALEAALDEKAAALAIDIARRLLERLPPDAANDVFVDALSRELRQLPERRRALIASAAARSAGLNIVSASALNDAQKKRCADALAAAAGREAALTFSVDPSLIAGIELKGPEIALANSWSSDLRAILEELNSTVEAHAAS